MKKSELRKIVRTIVREEVAMSIKEVIKEITQPTTKPKRKAVAKKHYSKNSVLNEVLNETANVSGYETMGDKVHTTDDMAAVMAKSYGDMMKPNDAKINVAEMAVQANVNPENVPDHVEEALTRDYSKLVKAMGTPGGVENNG